MPSALVMALYDSGSTAAAGAAAVRALRIDRDRLSIVARSHDEEGRLSERLGGTPGVEIEDSPIAARLGELSGQILAAIAVVLPGVGPIVTAGPLSAELSEAAGHAAGSLTTVLERAGLDEHEAAAWQREIEGGAIMLAAHADAAQAATVRRAFVSTGAKATALGPPID
jgi:hypothetical protein